MTKRLAFLGIIINTKEMTICYEKVKVDDMNQKISGI